MFVPAVRMGVFGSFWYRFYLLITGDICLGWAIASTSLANHEDILKVMIVGGCKIEDQECAQGALEVYIVGVLSPFINTDQCDLIIVGEEVGVLCIVARSPGDI